MTAYLEALFSLENKVAVVTGAAAGMGAAIAKGLAGAGAKIAVIDRDKAGCETTCQQILQSGGVARVFVLDLGQTAQIEPTLAQVQNAFGRVDILVNAAGITAPQKDTDSMEKRLDAFDKTLSINLRAAYAMSLAAAAHMAENGGGSIINLTSIASFSGYPDNPGYVASKGGLRMMSKALAIDLIKDNIRVNAIAPGYTKTAMTAGSQADPKLYAERLRHMIIPRWGEPEDMIGAAIFLASEASSYITGQDILVDGGWTAKGLT